MSNSLSKWLASKPDAEQLVRDAVQMINDAKPAQPASYHDEPVAEIIECQIMGGPRVAEIEGRWKFLRNGEMLYTRPAQPAALLVPLTDFLMADEFTTTPYVDDVFAAFQQGVKFAEKYHGITGAKP